MTSCPSYHSISYHTLYHITCVMSLHSRGSPWTNHSTERATVSTLAACHLAVMTPLKVSVWPGLFNRVYRDIFMLLIYWLIRLISPGCNVTSLMLLWTRYDSLRYTISFYATLLFVSIELYVLIAPPIPFLSHLSLSLSLSCRPLLLPPPSLISSLLHDTHSPYLSPPLFSSSLPYLLHEHTQP